MAAASTLQLASCKVSCATTSSTWSKSGAQRQALGEGSYASRPAPIHISSFSRRAGQKACPFRRQAVLGASSLFPGSNAKAATWSSILAVSAQAAEASEQVLAAEDVADAPQLDFSDIVGDAQDFLGDAKERVDDIVGDAQDRMGDFIDGAKDQLGDAFEGTRNLFEGSAEQTEGALESLQSRVEDLVTELPQVKAGEALQDLMEGAQDRVEDAGEVLQDLVENAQDRAEAVGDAMQDLVEGAQDRLESAQDAVKSFAEKVVDSVPDAPEQAQETAEPSAIQKFAEELSAPETEGTQEMLGGGAAEDGGQAVTGAISSFRESSEDAVGAAQESLSDAVDNAGAALREGKVDDVLQNAQDTFNSTLSGATDSIQDSASSAQQAVQASTDGTPDGLGGAIHSVQDAISGAVNSVTSSVSGAGSQLSTQADSFVKPLREIGVPIKSAINQVSAGVSESVSNVSRQVEGVLPPEARDVISSARKTAGELSGPLQSVLKEAGHAAGRLVVSAEEAVGFDPNDPAVTAVLVGGGVLALVLTWWLREKAGYGGDLTPEEALALLQKEGRALLVDVRPQRLRDAYGIPALKRGARFKLASVEPEQLDRTLRRIVRDATSVEYQILAAKIKGLKNVGSGSKVIVMDDRGQTSKDVARAVARTGVKKAYRLDGGYAAWAASQATREDAPEAPVAIIKEEAAFIAEETGIPAPILATGIGSGVVLGSVAIWEWEKTLQLIAVVGILSSIYSRVQTYSNVEDVKADLRLLQRPFQAGTGAFIWLFSRFDKVVGTPQLATSTGSSAQAAVEGPIPDSEEYDDPVEEEETKELPEPSASPVKASSTDQG